METKICITCGEEKPLSDYYFRKDTNKHFGECKSCCYKKSQQWRKDNRDRVLELRRKRYKQNPQKAIAATRDWQKRNPDRVRQTLFDWRKKNSEKLEKINSDWKKRHPGRMKELMNKWNKKNPDRLKEYGRVAWRKRMKRIECKLSHRIKNEIGRSLKGNKKGRHWEFLVGYTVDQLKQHLENQFVDGMNWDNYGKWHIDHIIPISFFQYNSPDDVEFKMCWRLENLQPLWAKDNLRKNNKLIKVA